MRIPSDTHEKMMSAYQLLQGEIISINTFEHIRTILKGFHPSMDEKLEICSKALGKLQKIQSADVIALSAEGLPENTEEERKRKKALLFFMRSIKDLKGEIKRIDTEFTQVNMHGNSFQNQLTAWGRIIGLAKGPFIIVTLVALIIVGVSLFTKQQSKTQNTSGVVPGVIGSPTSVINNLTKMQVIIYNGKQIPLSQLYIGHGPDCDSPHYHAKTGSVTTLDKTVIPDPENCGYGKLKDIQVIEVSISPTP